MHEIGILTSMLFRRARTGLSGVFGIRRQFGRSLAPALIRPGAVIEVVAGMVVVMAAGFLLEPPDPLFLDGSFPWIWLAANVFAMRYGALLGMLSGFCIWLGWLLLYPETGMNDFPTMLFVGGLVQVIVIGHFCDIWADRIRRLRSANNYLRDSLVSITNNHYLLRASHERLEQDALARPATLRDAIEHLRSLPAPAHSGTPFPNAQAVLEFVATACQITEAAVFPMSSKGFSSAAVASVGVPFELSVDDALVAACVEQRALTHLRQSESWDSAYLACVPIVGTSGNFMGILAVRRMPFLALNTRNLELLLVLFNYYADGLEEHAVAAPVQAIAQCPYGFAVELGRLARMRKASGIRSSLLGVVCPSGFSGDSLYDRLMQERRSLDLLWRFSSGRSHVVIVLMPFTDDRGIDGYLDRVNSNVKTQLDMDFTEAGVTLYRADVDAVNPGAGLKNLLGRCRSHG
ncbi:hypothetical protein EKL30_01495 [Candidimonas sp. SYP-B2681]|uniref:PelD GGDEF domain-containing protein n=1 Tax=Candidimonas sp. SYP-B2681 TaxID=2497686 RepID=UPI000F865D3F|nr:PelD GGDEF domain-containing protein [Candidimonas sp. SYP-B2681]RTZ47695.1 hypothetical protein EKL30_01495 [Candidimonas sp. SYP-B2681]